MSNDLRGLLGPLGVVGHTRPVSSGRGLDRLNQVTAYSGDTHGDGHAPQTGTGRVLDSDLAETIAIAEAAERYVGALPMADVIEATADELDEPTIDLAAIPRCSQAEYDRSDCELIPFDPRASIRWITGRDLHTGNSVWLPAVMACYGLHPRPNERFSYQISTGYAVHTAPERAVLGGLLEVIERDAISLTWLQRLPLPPLSPQAITEPVARLVDIARRRFMTTWLFNATTDIRIPTVYVLQRAPHDRLAVNIIGAGTGHTLAEAAEKALIEVLTIRPLFRDTGPIEEFTQITDGARYMGTPEHSGAFDFLTDGLQTRPASHDCDELPGEPRDAIIDVVGRLTALGMQAVCVDRTTSELRDVGLCALTVVIPQLQPMSLNPAAQFRAHPRLASAPRRLGYPAYGEQEQNQWPQPFA